MHDKRYSSLNCLMMITFAFLISLWELELTVLSIQEDQPIRYLKTDVC